MDLSQGLKRLVGGVDENAKCHFVVWSLHISNSFWTMQMKFNAHKLEQEARVAIRRSLPVISIFASIEAFMSDRGDERR